MVNEKTVRNVSKIAKLQLSEAEVEQYTKEFQEILELFSTLASAPTDNTFTLTPTQTQPSMREDKSIQKDYKEDALSLTSHRVGDYFKGPKTL